jgi:NADH-quinone oxidoreductase subunit J
MEILQGITPGALVFFGLATLVVASAAGVAFSRNILYAGFALLGTLGGIAGLYLYMGADFLGIAQLIIYVGGILVLILFAILLTNKIGDVRITNLSVSLPIGGAVAAILLLLLAYVGTQTTWPETEAVVTPTTARLGDAFLREYLLPFELASVILLMALVGAMVIARRAAKEDPRGPEPGYERLV